MDLEHHGSMKFFDVTKGFGIIESDAFETGVYLSASVLKKCGQSAPIAGQEVHFSARESEGRHTGKMEATYVRLGKLTKIEPKSNKELTLWEGTVRTADSTIWQVTVTSHSLKMVSDDVFHTYSKERRLSRVTDVQLEFGWLGAPTLTIAGGGGKDHFSRNPFGAAPPIAGTSQSLTARHGFLAALREPKSLKPCTSWRKAIFGAVDISQTDQLAPLIQLN